MTKTPGTKEDWFFAFDSYVIQYMTKTWSIMINTINEFENYVI